MPWTSSPAPSADAVTTTARTSPDSSRRHSTCRSCPGQLLDIERALRERELTWAQKRVVTEQVARAREALLREFKAWGVSTGSDAQADAVLREVLASGPPGIQHEIVEAVDPLEPDPVP